MSMLCKLNHAKEEISLISTNHMEVRKIVRGVVIVSFANYFNHHHHISIIRVAIKFSFLQDAKVCFIPKMGISSELE